MATEYKSFMHVLACIIRQETIEIEEKEFLTYYTLARKQGIGALFYEAFCNKLELKEYRDKLSMAYLATLQKGMMQEREFEAIAEEAEKRQLTIVCYKGSILKRLYSNPYLRLMGDMDFGYDETKEAQIIQMMEDLGYEYKKEYGHHRDFSKPPYLEIEFHGKLHEEDMDFEMYGDFMDNTIPYENYQYVSVLNPTLHFMFLITHIYQHMVHGGAGIRNYIDLYLFIKNYDEDIHYDEVADDFSDQGLKKFYIKTLEFLQRAFETDLYVNPMDETLYDEYLSQIFSGGIYGRTDNSEREAVLYGASGKSKGKYIFRRLFPKFETMKMIYPVLKKKAMVILLPPFYLWRIISFIFTPRKVKAKMKFMAESKEQAKNQKNFAEAIGLDIKKGRSK